MNNWPVNPGWTDERIEKLKALHKEGYSAGQMAAELGFVTRNAVIGKSNRLGLGPIGGGKASAPRLAPKRPPRPQVRRYQKPKSIKGGDVATANRVENIAARQQPAENVLQMARAFAPLPGREPVAFGSPGCRWPVAGEGADMRCCGAERIAATQDRPSPSYCASHEAAATRPTPKKSSSRKAYHNSGPKKAWAA